MVEISIGALFGIIVVSMMAAGGVAALFAAHERGKEKKYWGDLVMLYKTEAEKREKVLEGIRMNMADHMVVRRLIKEWMHGPQSPAMVQDQEVEP